MRTFLLATAALGLVSTAAHAQEAAWSGPYVGAQFGYTRTDAKKDETVRFDTNLDGTYGDTVNTAAGANAFSPGFCSGSANTSLPGGGCREDKNGAEFGARMGYDWQFGSIVVGPVLEVNRINLKDSAAAFSTTPAQYSFERKLKNTYAARLRAGYAFGDNLIYGAGGVVRGDVEHAFNTTNTANTFVQRGDDKTNGYQWGGGYERKLTQNVSVGMEYLYTKLDDGDYTVRSQGPVPATNPFVIVNPNGTDLRRSDDEFKFHSFRVTANYRF